MRSATVFAGLTVALIAAGCQTVGTHQAKSDAAGVFLVYADDSPRARLHAAAWAESDAAGGPVMRQVNGVETLARELNQDACSHVVVLCSAGGTQEWTAPVQSFVDRDSKHTAVLLLLGRDPREPAEQDAPAKCAAVVWMQGITIQETDSLLREGESPSSVSDGYKLPQLAPPGGSRAVTPTAADIQDRERYRTLVRRAAMDLANDWETCDRLYGDRPGEHRECLNTITASYAWALRAAAERNERAMLIQARRAAGG